MSTEPKDLCPCKVCLYERAIIQHMHGLRSVTAWLAEGDVLKAVTRLEKDLDELKRTVAAARAAPVAIPKALLRKSPTRTFVALCLAYGMLSGIWVYRFVLGVIELWR